MNSVTRISASSVTGSIMNCDDFSQLRNAILAPVSRLLGARSAVFLQFRHDPAGKVFIDTAIYDGLRPESLSAYVAGRFQDDPIVRPMLRFSDRWGESTEPVLWHLERSVPNSTLRNSSYFNEFLNPHQVGDIIAVAFPVNIDGPQLLCVGIHKPLGDSGFEEVHELALEAVSQPMRVALRGICLNAELATARRVSSSNSERLGIEFMTFDERLNIDGASEALRERLVADHRFADGMKASLQTLLRESGADLAAADDGITVLLPNGLQGQLRLLESSEGRRYMLTCSAARAGDEASRPRATGPDCDYDELTPRERDVARLVAEGQRNREIAGALGISTRTVENHLRAIYEKLGVENRARLITHLLANSQALFGDSSRRH